MRSESKCEGECVREGEEKTTPQMAGGRAERGDPSWIPSWLCESECENVDVRV